jgi:beta-barrel assembly-enhancing protease
MFKRLFLMLRGSQKRFLYGLLSVSVALGLFIGNPQPSHSIDLLRIIERGLQVLPEILQFSTISDAQEVQLGQQINQQLVSSGKVKILRNGRVNAYLNDIGQRLARNSVRPNIPYTFQAVNDNSINAFATMGGFVYIHTGLMTKADNEAELASVIAHEIGHIAGQHAIRQLQDQAIARGLLSATGLDRSTFVQLGVELAVNLPNSRGDEFEADRMGLKTLVQTGYAPAGMISLMKKLQRQGSSAPSFLSTHPAAADRAAVLEQSIDPRIANQGAGLDSRAYQNKLRSF